MAVLSMKFIQAGETEQARHDQVIQLRLYLQEQEALALSRALAALDEKAAPLLGVLAQLKDEANAGGSRITYLRSVRDDGRDGPALEIQVRHVNAEGLINKWEENWAGTRTSFHQESSQPRRYRRRFSHDDENSCSESILFRVSKKGISAIPQDYRTIQGNTYDGRHYSHVSSPMKSVSDIKTALAQWAGRVAPDILGDLKTLAANDAPASGWKSRLGHFLPWQ